MADQILDARTLLWDAGDGTGGAPDNLAGTGLTNSDTSTFIEGSTSYALSITNSVLGQLYDAGTAQNWSNNTFWLWVNCGVVGLLNAKASGGVTVRFCGNTVTDWFEVYVGGNDSWPVTFEGGWAVFVIDIEEAHTNSDNTNGTKPGTNAIRYVGMTATTSVMPKMADNFWMDAIFRNPTANAAWTVEGQNGGTTDWTFADVAAQLTVGSGLVIPIDGDSFYVTGPGQFGANDTENHGFTSLNDTILWADQEFVLDGFYGFSALGNSGGTTNVTFGQKSGTGDTATGSQGASIKSGSANARWDMDFNDPNLDLIAFYGCSLIHSGDLLLDDPAVSFISTLFIDGNSALVSNAEILSCSVIAANTADGVAYMTTDDLSDIVNCTFEFSDGHAIELTTPNTSAQTSKGNIFTGYAAQGGTANDRMVYNNSGAGLVTLSITGGGTLITYRNGTSATTTVVSSADYTLTGIENDTEVTILDNDVSALDITGTPTAQPFGQATGVDAIGQSFQTAVTMKVERIRVNVRKVGSPTDGFTVKLVNGVPGSSVLAESLPFPAADLTTTLTEHDVYFTSKQSVTAATTYGLEFQRTGATSDTDYYEIEYDTGNPHTSGARYTGP